jgi:hypothetical protein
MILNGEAGMPRWIFGSGATINFLKENAIKENIMHKLKVLSAALALLVVTPVLAQEMGGATGPGSAGGLEPTYNDGYYNGYNQRGELSPGGVGDGVRALKGNNSYAMSPEGERASLKMNRVCALPHCWPGRRRRAVRRVP